MFRFLPGPVGAALVLVLGSSLTILIFFLLLLPFAIAKLAIPHAGWRTWCTRQLVKTTTLWAHAVNFSLGQGRQPKWDLQALDGFNPQGKYLLLSNHTTWMDIPVLFRVFPGRIPFPRPFIKQQLIWLPIIGFSAWAIDCPFMRRYTKEELEKHPEWRGRDVETTRRSCEKFRQLPVTVLNYVEGTRFNEAKRIARKSPYKNLLRPKSAGVAFVLNAMGDQFETIINMTIAYTPGVDTSFWNCLCGNMPEVTMRFETMPVPAEFVHGNYQEDPVFQKNFQAWMTRLWDRKQVLIDELHAQMDSQKNASTRNVT
jgi:1-acyl-sn-glycerol-3-phosphate acyltransferase